MGAAACLSAAGTPCDLSSGIVTDDDAGTVTFHLTEPAPDFLYALALPFAYAVPAASPDVLANGDTLPATGPYVIDRYQEDEELVLVRNPEFGSWSEVARPDGFPDRIVWRLGSDLDQMITDTLTGAADLLFSPLLGQLAELSRSHASQVQLSPRPQTYYMNLNTQLPPFDDVEARRALNLAVDRARVEALAKGTFRTTCQILPGNLPGYSPYCPYTQDPGASWTAPDLARAQELVDRSGTAGTKVTVWASDALFPASVPVGRYFRDLLRRLGYRASLEVVDDQAWSAATFGRPPRAQITFLGWTADFATAPGFIAPVFACDGSSNVSGFCDPSIDRRMEEAARVRPTDPAGAVDAWSKIEHDLVDQAVWVPLGNGSWASIVSRRLGNYQSNPQWGPLVDQMWVR